MIVDLSKPKRKRKAWVYKDKYDALKKDRDQWRKAFICAMLIIFVDVIGKLILDLIGLEWAIGLALASCALWYLIKSFQGSIRKLNHSVRKVG